MADSPIFILGMQRGGTNQINHILCSHPATYWPPGEFHQAIKYQRRRTERLPGLRRAWRRHAPRWLRRGNPLNPSRPAAAPGLLEGGGGAVLDTLRDAATANRGKVRAYKQALLEAGLIDAVPEPDRMMCKLMSYNLELVPELRRTWPGAVFVGVMRDGRAVCEGNMARGVGLAAAAATYDFVGRRMVELAAEGAPIRTWRFEDLLVDPAGVAREIYGFCGLDAGLSRGVCMHDKVRVHDDDGLVVGIERDERFYRFEDLGSHMRMDANDQSLARLSPGDRAEIEARCAGVLAHFGYLGDAPAAEARAGASGK